MKIHRPSFALFLFLSFGSGQPGWGQENPAPVAPPIVEAEEEPAPVVAGQFYGPITQPHDLHRVIE